MTNFNEGRLGTYERGDVAMKVSTGLVISEKLNLNPFYLTAFEPMKLGYPRGIENYLNPEFDLFGPAITDLRYSPARYFDLFNRRFNRLCRDLEDHSERLGNLLHQTRGYLKHHRAGEGDAFVGDLQEAVIQSGKADPFQPDSPFMNLSHWMGYIVVLIERNLISRDGEYLNAFTENLGIWFGCKIPDDSAHGDRKKDGHP